MKRQIGSRSWSAICSISPDRGGALRPQKDWYDIDELIVDVRARLARG